MDSAALVLPPFSGHVDDQTAPPAVPSLQELCISYIARHLHLFPSLASLPYHLAELVIRTRGNHRVRDADLPLMIGNGHAPAAQMDYLSFRGCALVTPSGFCGVLPHFVELVVIDFSMCEQVDDSVISCLSRCCKRLSTLDVTACKLLTDACAGSIASMCCLAELNMEMVSRVTDAGLQTIMRSCGPKLTAVNIGCMMGISNVGVSIMADHAKQLLELHLCGCGYVTDFDIVDICKGLLRLQTLDLRACRRVGNKGVGHFVAAYKRRLSKQQSWVTSLDLGGLVSINDSAVCALAETCTPLTSLDLRGCSGLTMDSVQTVRFRLKRLQHFVPPPCAGRPPFTARLLHASMKNSGLGSRHMIVAAAVNT